MACYCMFRPELTTESISRPLFECNSIENVSLYCLYPAVNALLSGLLLNLLADVAKAKSLHTYVHTYIYTYT